VDRKGLSYFATTPYLAFPSIVAAGLVALAGCAQLDAAAGGIADAAARPDAVTGRRQLNLLSAAEESRKGAETEQQILEACRKQSVAIDSDEPTRAHLQGIMERIVAVSHRPEVPVRLHLIEAGDWNAFAILGGYVFVFRGILTGPMALQSDDEIAAVLGHEWTHFTAGHIAESTSRTQLDRGMQKSALFRAAFTTEHEDEADRVGVLYAALAGYDPEAAPRVWRRVLAHAGEGQGFLYDHPLNRARIESTGRYATLARKYCVSGSVNPRARDILANNDLAPRSTERTSGIAALAEALLQYQAEEQRTHADVAGRRANRAQAEARLSQESGMAGAEACYRRGDLNGAVQQYAEVLKRNEANYLAWYNCACCLARGGANEQALRALAAAVQAGFHDYRLMKTDPDLRALRGSPDFDRLFEQAKAID